MEFNINFLDLLCNLEDDIFQFTLAVNSFVLRGKMKHSYHSHDISNITLNDIIHFHNNSTIIHHVTSKYTNDIRSGRFYISV